MIKVGTAPCTCIDAVVSNREYDLRWRWLSAKTGFYMRGPVGSLRQEFSGTHLYIQCIFSDRYIPHSWGKVLLAGSRQRPCRLCHIHCPCRCSQIIFDGQQLGFNVLVRSTPLVWLGKKEPTLSFSVTKEHSWTYQGHASNWGHVRNELLLWIFLLPLSVHHRPSLRKFVFCCFPNKLIAQRDLIKNSAVKSVNKTICLCPCLVVEVFDGLVIPADYRFISRQFLVVPVSSKVLTKTFINTFDVGLSAAPCWPETA